jgi:Domain of unknown function (DUF6456)
MAVIMIKSSFSITHVVFLFPTPPRQWQEKTNRTEKELRMQTLYVDRSLCNDRVVDANKRFRSVRVNLAESPLSRLHARGHLSERLFLAGETLRIDFARAGLASRTTMDWDASPIGKGQQGANMPDIETLERIDAKRRFDAAVAHAGSGLTDILWRVVCAGETLPLIEEQLGWPRRCARVVLTLALDRVADYYRIN